MQPAAISSAQTDLAAGTKHDSANELKAVAVLAAGFGLVGLDRFIINPLFPVIAKDLNLGYQALGMISAVLALTWGLSSVLTGRLADRYGNRSVLVPAALAFSTLVALSGAATGLLSMLLIRGLMGFAEGAYVPASIAATAQASKPTRLGLNIGLQQMASPLIGLGLGPIVAVGLLKVTTWHWVFAVVAIPGFILAYLMWKIVRDAPQPQVSARNPAAAGPWLEALRYRNVIFNTLGMFCWLSCLIVAAAFMPNYLTDHLKLSLDQMGFVLTGQGIGAAIGMIIVPAISDRIGRKPAMMTALIISLVTLWMLRETGAEPGKLFALLFLSTFMNAGVVSITVGPLTSETVPAHLAATATGIVVGLGEIFGGALAPVIAGGIAERAGIVHVLDILIVAIAVGCVIAGFGIREPARSQRHS